MPLPETGYTTLHVRRDGAVGTVTLDNPPVNILNTAMAADLIRVVREAKADDTLRVIIVESANPEFFSAHADANWMFDPSDLMALADDEGDPALNPLQQLHERFRTLPQVTIAKLRGRLRGGGSELAMAADMRFAARGQTWLAQPETRMGNAVMGSWFSSLRAELTDRSLIWNLEHLLRVLREYEVFYNGRRPYRSLDQAAPMRPLPDNVIDLDDFRVRRRDRAGGHLHEYQQVA